MYMWKKFIGHVFSWHNEMDGGLPSGRGSRFDGAVFFSYST